MFILLFYLLVFFISFFIPLLLADEKNRISAPMRSILLKIPHKSLREIIAILLMIFPALFILTFRYGMGSDYFTYQTMYTDYIHGGYINDEYGLIGLFAVSGFLGLGYRGFLFFAAFIGLFVAAWALKTVCSPKVYAASFLMYLCLFFGPMCNIIAQTIAIPIVFLAFYFLMNKRPVVYVSLCVLASFFHMTVLLLIPLYWIYHYLFQKRPVVWTILILFAGILCAFAPDVLRVFMNNPLLKKYMGYLSYDRIGTWAYMFVYRLPLYAAELICLRKLLQQNKNNLFWYFILALELASLFLGTGIAWGGRFCYYFSVAHIVLSCQIFTHYRKMPFPGIIRQAIFAYYILAFSFMHFYSEFDRIMAYQFSFIG